jgi:pimeloyl-ACP methyl ester carboxylesterase
MPRIESLLTARLFLNPQWVGERLYFISNLSGRLSLYAMREAGSVPEPLIPPDIALPTPELIEGAPFQVFPQLNTIFLMLDHDGDEVYRPHLIPLEGGYPEAIFTEAFARSRVHCTHLDPETAMLYFTAESMDEPLVTAWRADLRTQQIERLGEGSTFGYYTIAAAPDGGRIILLQGYTPGDTILYQWTEAGGLQGLYGKPLEQRAPDETVTPSGIGSAQFTRRGLLLTTSLFDDHYGPGYLDLNKPDSIYPVSISGLVHTGTGEMENIVHMEGSRYQVQYNIDGCTWLYEATFDEDRLSLTLDRVIAGQGMLAGGVLKAYHYNRLEGRYALSFCTATSPTQLYTLDRAGIMRQRTNERPLGIGEGLLSNGEDASFTSHDGLRISARLYLPAPVLGFEGPRPLVYYIHGGPQSQERPNFAWFSMPLIQFFTLNGFAVFVPNARGSSGYGLSYMKHVDHDWGGQDRLDHVHAMTQVLPHDPRLDVKRAAVVGRSYGGYMTLTLASRHPELWSAAVDMFGPYNLLTFCERIPETWKAYFTIALGDPVNDRDFLLERSPSQYIRQVTCPMLVIQGANDPRVVERESRDVVEQLQAVGKPAEIIVFEDEGHDVLKFANRVRCYNAITDFFKRWLM